MVCNRALLGNLVSDARGATLQRARCASLWLFVPAPRNYHREERFLRNVRSHVDLIILCELFHVYLFTFNADFKALFGNF
jgi:hypothetical protein